MTKEEIVQLVVVDNNLVVEVYDILHNIVIANVGKLESDAETANAELRLIKKFADTNKLSAIKDILSED